MNFGAIDIWSPSSQDFNALDFSIWAKLQPRVSVHHHHNIDTQKSTITKAWNKLSSDKITNVYSRFWSSIEAGIRAEGVCIDKIDNGCLF